MRYLTASIIALKAISITAPAFSADCNMKNIAVHSDAGRTRIFASTTGMASLYYQANMDVNTDGTARSYHPDDPRGEKLAYNNIGNAISRILDSKGKDVTCSPRKGACYKWMIETFEAARDSNYDTTGRPSIETDQMIPWKKDPDLNRRVPCKIESGVFKGYFVSQTSLIVDPTKSECDQARYLDSFTFNAVVLPKKAIWRSQGTPTDGGDIVVVRNVQSGTVAYAINGDRGPVHGIGEGTIRLAAILKGANVKGDETYHEIKKLVVGKVQYVVFPRNDIRTEAGKSFSQADIDRVGAKLFQEWGGVARLDACKGAA